MVLVSFNKSFTIVALNARAKCINEPMKIAAAQAIANFIGDDKLSADYIIPSPLDRAVAASVAEAVAKAAQESGVSGVKNAR